MKPLLLLTLVAASLQAQSTVNFNNRVLSAGVDAPVYLGVIGGDKLQGDSWRAQLFIGLPESALSPAGDDVGFRTGLAAGYVNVGTDGSRTTPYPSGTLVVARIRAWSEDGAYEGWSDPISVTTGDPLLPPVDLVGLAPFAVTAVPEPPLITLLILGLALTLKRKATPHEDRSSGGKAHAT